MKINPTKTVAVNFTITKTGRFELTNPEISGLSSCVPKNTVPKTVVKQSREPIKTRNKLGNVL
jgi:hypothetical protein